MADDSVLMNRELLLLCENKIPATRTWKKDLNLSKEPLKGSHNKPLVCASCEMLFSRIKGDRSRMLECLDWWDWYADTQPLSGGESLTPEEVYRSMMIYAAFVAAAVAVEVEHPSAADLLTYTRAHVTWLALGAGAGPGRKVTDHHLGNTSQPCVLVGDGKPIWHLPYIAQAGARGWIRNREKGKPKTFYFTESSGLSVTVGQAAAFNVPRKPNTWQADMFAATCKLSPGIAPLGFEHEERALLREFLRTPQSVALAMRVVQWVSRYTPPQPHSFVRYQDGSVCAILHESHRSSTDPRMVDIWLVGGKTLKTSADDGLRSSSAPQTASETIGSVICHNREMGWTITVEKPQGPEAYRVTVRDRVVTLTTGSGTVDLEPDPVPIPPNPIPPPQPKPPRRRWWEFWR